ncbi:MAG: hypothetical protein FD180_3577 [Planctomycetota bacterium]|nr:MAG: hypothetical protein FD180_3577 [Planctomycetota bacterium]
MGYTTEFEGEFQLDRPLTPEHRAFLAKFSETRRMKRRAEVTALRPDPLRNAAGLPVGFEGAFFVGADAEMGQEHTPDIVDWNRPPHNQPGLWCKWAPNERGTAVAWNGHEKFVEYVPWLDYLIRNFLKPWGYVLKGTVEFQGEELDDFGRIHVRENVVRLAQGEGPQNARMRDLFEPTEEEDEE